MLIPSIDLMGGKIVQLVQGEKKKLEFSDFNYWIERFSKYPLVQVIDLDAARGVGDNQALLRPIFKRLNCQVGGGVRDLEAARELLQAGARKVILGSSLLNQGEIDTHFARELAEALGTEPLVFAIDSRNGRVAVEGWRKQTDVTALDMIRALEPFCETFLYTNIETEGLMGGMPLEPVQALRSATTRHLVVAGGITTQDEIDALDAIGIDAVVGMAVYSGKLPLTPASGSRRSAQLPVPSTEELPPTET
jgi:phosphoribosylformimino-5-aminoimidazole carboxamide ribotide isomerase